MTIYTEDWYFIEGHWYHCETVKEKGGSIKRYVNGVLQKDKYNENVKEEK